MWPASLARLPPQVWLSRSGPSTNNGLLEILQASVILPSPIPPFDKLSFPPGMLFSEEAGANIIATVRSAQMRCSHSSLYLLTFPTKIPSTQQSCSKPLHPNQFSFFFFGQILIYLYVISYLLYFFIIYLALLKYKLNEASSLCLFCSKIDSMCLAHCLTHSRSLTTI